MLFKDQLYLASTYNAVLFGLKMNKILTYATTSIKLEYIILSEISQPQKTNTLLQVVKFIETQ